MTGSPPDALASMQAYRLLIFNRAQHPEFFDVRGNRSIQTDQYTVDLWVSRGSHLLLFCSADDYVGEVMVPDDQSTPPRGCVEILPFTTERDHEALFANRIRYITTVQTEVLSDNLYRSLLDEMIEFTVKRGVLAHRWMEAESRFESGSFIDVQRLAREVHVQSWHLDATSGLVVRSQTIFELVGVRGRG